jgi:hypothetical protein
MMFGPVPGVTVTSVLSGIMVPWALRTYRPPMLEALVRNSGSAWIIVRYTRPKSVTLLIWSPPR